MRRTAAALALIAIAALAGCSGGDDQYVIASDYASELGVNTWPLTVDRVNIVCHDQGQITIEADGTEYYLNGLAKGAGEYADLNLIWKDSETTPGLKMGMSDLINFATAMCESN